MEFWETNQKWNETDGLICLDKVPVMISSCFYVTSKHDATTAKAVSSNQPDGHPAQFSH